MGKKSKREIAIRLKAKTIQAANGCWEWTGGFHGVGYGSVPAKMGGGRYAHRAMHEAVISEIPKGMYVLHSCDNRKCINPEHLFIGSHMDNIKDMHAKNRQRGGSMPGEKNPHAKFTDDEISRIRSFHKMGAKKREIERKFGISETHYYRIIKQEARHGEGQS